MSETKRERSSARRELAQIEAITKEFEDGSDGSTDLDLDTFSELATRVYCQMAAEVDHSCDQSREIHDLKYDMDELRAELSRTREAYQDLRNRISSTVTAMEAIAFGKPEAADILRGCAERWRGILAAGGGE